MLRLTPQYALVSIIALVLVGCASPVDLRPTQLMQSSTSTQRFIIIKEQTDVKPANGYRRIIKSGSIWKYMGATPEGEAYKIQNDVFMVEGANMHEAYAVLDGEMLVGFYLPVKQAFAPLDPAITLNFRHR